MVIGMPRSQLYRAARTYHGSLWDAANALLHFDIGYLWTNLVTGKSMPYGLQREKALNLFSDYNVSEISGLCFTSSGLSFGLCLVSFDEFQACTVAC